MFSTVKSLFSILLVVCLLSLCAAHLNAQPEDKTRPVVVIPPVVVAPVQGIAPVKVGPTQGALALNRLGDDAKHMAALLQLQAGALSPEEAWNNGTFGEADVRRYFLHDANLWIIGALQENKTLNLALETLLVERGQTLWATLSPAQLSAEPARLRLWVGDYYWRQGNAAVAIPILRSILDGYKPPVAAYEDHTLLHQAAERIAWMQRDAGHPLEAARTFERVSQMMADTKGNGIAADTLWEASRLYDAAGEHAKADEARAKVTATGNGMFQGVLAIGRAQELEAQGQNAQSIQLLEAAIPGALGTHTGVAMRARVALLLYKEGDLKRAKEVCAQALQENSQLSESDQNASSLPAYIAQVKECGKWLTRWDKQGYELSSPSLQVVPEAPTGQGPQTRRLYRLWVRTPRALKWSATCSVEGAEVRLSLGASTYFYEEEQAFVQLPSTLWTGTKAPAPGGKLGTLTLKGEAGDDLNAAPLQIEVPILVAPADNG